jgi:hypothetical protein
VNQDSAVPVAFIFTLVFFAIVVIFFLFIIRVIFFFISAPHRGVHPQLAIDNLFFC